MLGTGEPRYQDLWRGWRRRIPTRIGVRVGFDESLAHLIEGGADMFLMPSRFEPCGLNQMYSLRYGTVPVVRAVGGLADTVRDYGSGAPGATGFVVSGLHPGRAAATRPARAVAAFADQAMWPALQIGRDGRGPFLGPFRGRVRQNI